MKSLTWQQVNAWRLSQHCLAHRLTHQKMVEAVSCTMGVHAQVMSAAEMAIAARVDGITPQDVQSALWAGRSLVKTWMMRQTLHLVPAVDFPMYVAARRITDIRWPELFSQKGVDRATYDAYMSLAPEILNSGPLTRQQFVEAVDTRLKSPELSTFLTNSSWGTAFKPLAWHGDLCFGPNDGSTTTFISPSAWIGAWQEMNPEAALQEVARRYLTAYGPAKLRNFQVWWWMSGTAAKKAFNLVAEETEEVDVEGWHATSLKSAIHSMLEMEPRGEVHLLPAFDAYIVGSPRGKDLERLIRLEFQKKVYRPQGWVSAVVLVDGFIKGTWEYKPLRSSTSVKVYLFSPAASEIKEAIALEADRLGKFLNSPIALEFIQN